MSADTASRSRGAIRPRFAGNFLYPPVRGRRECRAPDAPDSREELGLKEGDDVDVTATDAQTIVLSKCDDKGDFIVKLRVLQKPKPAGFVWNRDDANAR